MIMTKRLVSYLVSAIVLFFITYPLHTYLLQISGEMPPYSLLSIYLFQGIVSLFLVLIFELLAYTEQYNDKLGLLYLGSSAIKIIFFFLFFKDVLFSSIALSKMDRLSLLVAFFIFVFYEVFFIVKILNRKS